MPILDSCNVDECKAIVYKDCPDSEHCGETCEYLPDGIGDKTNCAWNPCSEISGTKGWVNICRGIDAIDVKGGCSFALARGNDGSNPYHKVYQGGFHGLWKTYIDGVHLGDNVGSVKFTCPPKSKFSMSYKQNRHIKQITIIS